MTAAIDRGVSRPVGSSGRDASRSSGSASGAASSASARSAATPSSPGSLSTCTVQSSGTGCPGTSGVGEEVHRRLRPRRAPGASSRRARRSPSPAGRAAAVTSGRPAPRAVRGGKVSDSSRAPGAGGDARRGELPLLPHDASPPRNSTAGSPDARTAATSSITDGAACGAGRTGSGSAGVGAVLPGHVGRQDSVAIVARGRGGDRLGGVGGDVGRRQGPPDPSGDGAGERVDVGLQRRVQPLVRARVVADDVDQRRPAAAGVVQVRQPVAQARPQVQQGGGGAAGHARVAVGRAGGHALEQRQHAAHLGDVVERGDEVHLRRARVGEADVHARVDQRPDQCLRAVHHAVSSVGLHGLPQPISGCGTPRVQRGPADWAVMADDAAGSADARRRRVGQRCPDGTARGGRSVPCARHAGLHEVDPALPRRPGAGGPRLTRAAAATHPPATATEAGAAAAALWRAAEFREERYAAQALVGLPVARGVLHLLPLLEEMITTGAWWDFVDGPRTGSASCCAPTRPR